MKILKPEILGVIAISIAAIAWGLDGIALTPKLYNLDVPFVVFMLHVIPAILMTPFLGKYWKNLLNYKFQDVLSLWILAFFGGALGTISIVKALFLVKFDHLSVIVILQKLQPLFAIILAMIFLKERPNKQFWIWAFIALLGGYFLTFEFHLPKVSQQANLIEASLYSLLAAFSFGAGTVFSKRSLSRLNFKEVTYFRYFFTSIIVGLFVFTSGKMGYFQLVTKVNWFYLFLISLTVGIGSIFLYNYGLKRVKAIVSTIAELLFPISSIFFDYVINGNKLSLIQMISAGVMVLAIIRISKQYSH
ncbi:DMT family transporter [bacterium]|nr:DMT family transporter [bacterium]